jgi:hypothetical protein
MSPVQAAKKIDSLEALQDRCAETQEADCVSRVRFCNWFRKQCVVAMYLKLGFT